MRPVILFCVLLSLSTAILWGQSGTGVIEGTVRDPGGAVIPAAKVKATHAATAGTRESQTNGAGFFIFPSLPIGAYKVTVEAPGMQTWEGALVLQVGQTAVLNPALNLSSVSTQITVAGDVTPLTVTDSATLGQVLERNRIEQLPINGRFVTSLVGVTIPGVEGSRPFGLRESAMEYVQDGAALVNRDTGGLTTRPPGLDTVEEFKVETNNSSAKVNRPATVILSTKAGTNNLHGSLFETARNNAIGVARRRQDFYTKPPHLVRNEFGGSVGGPIYIPKLYNGRNRTFFFAAWEGYRNYSSTTVNLSMPTMPMRQGDFSGLIDSVGRRYTLYDPFTTDAKWARTPFPNNQIPISRISPLAKYAYSVTPVPTHPDRNPLVTSNFYAPGPEIRTDNTLTLRLDHRISDRDQVFLRVTHGDNMREYMGADPTFPTLDRSTGVTDRSTRNMNGVFSWTHIISPTFFSETLANWSYENLDFYAGDFFHDWAGKLGLPNPFGELGFPYITNTGFDMEYTQPDNRRNNRTWIAGLDQNFTKVAGKHEIQFGARFRNERGYVLPDRGGASGRHAFNSCATCLYDPASGTTYSAVPRTGHDSANFFLGVAANYTAVYTQKMYHFRDREYAFYLQDNWKVTPKLTINFGLRYEYHPPLDERDKLFTGFDMQQHAIVNGLSLDELAKIGRTTPEIVDTFTRIGVKFLSAKEAGLPSTLQYSDPYGFGPRVGLAYRIGSGKRAVVVRSGYALYVYPPPFRNFDSPIRSNPPFQATFSKSYTSAAQSPDGLPNYAMRSVPTVIAGVNSATAIDPKAPGGVSRGGFTTSYFDPDQPLTRVSEWNFTLEREILANTVVRASYVGVHGFNLEQFQQFNQQPNNYVWFATTGQPLPTGEFSGSARRSYDTTTYGDIRRYQKTGWSNNNSITLEAQRRSSKGYAFQFFYVLGNSFRVAGDGWRDDPIPQVSTFLPGAVPTDVNELNRFYNYRRDTDIPHQRLRWNWLVDLPFGRGKRFAGNASGVLEKLIGGWQVAGFGTYRSRYWSLPTSNWGPTGKVEVYGKKYPIKDCRSGTCIPGYLYWNGYIAANRINSYDPKTGKPNGIMGVPDIYKPSNVPLIPIPKDGGSSADPLSPYYDSQTVFVTMKNGSVQRTSMDTGLHPWRNQYVAGPWQFGMDASLFKAVRIGERAAVRFNADFFQVLNNPGTGMPGSNGVLNMQNSSNSPRELQLTLRLTF